MQNITRDESSLQRSEMRPRMRLPLDSETAVDKIPSVDRIARNRVKNHMLEMYYIYYVA